MGGATVLVEQAGGIATVTLNRPQARNALNLTMRAELERALRQPEGDAGVRVLLVRGAGEHCCAGGDVKLMQASRMTAAEGRSRVEAMSRAVLALARFPTPTIAMVLGAGSRDEPDLGGARSGDDDRVGGPSGRACGVLREANAPVQGPLIGGSRGRFLSLTVLAAG